MTIQERRGELAGHGPHFGEGTLWRRFARPRLTRKKDGPAAEQEMPDVLVERRAWFEEQIDLHPGRLVLVDERWASTNMTARYGRCLRGVAVAAGEDLVTDSRSLGVSAATLTTWRGAFLSAGEAAPPTRPERGEALENGRLKAKLGEVMIGRDLLHEKNAVPETGRCLARRSAGHG